MSVVPGERRSAVPVRLRSALVLGLADYIVDIGPGAGGEGGKIVFEGTPAELARARKGKTSGFLARELREPVKFT